ncbi:hypothetical protein ABH931_006819 [Streptacidiphilus sp. MAP12-33]|uniref:hypothetical protein n=1 Tax=Streptacidiphilus sp. MAP12-33 TaxID=3156266 RepID=UPI0035121A92
MVEQATSSTTTGGTPGSVHVLRLGFANGLLDGLCLSRAQTIYAKFDQVSGTVQNNRIPGLRQTPEIGISVRPGDVPCPAPQAPTGTP